MFFSASAIAFSQNDWTTQNSTTTSWLTCVKTVNQEIAWAGGDSGIVIRTTNGGNSWIRVGKGTLGTSERLNTIDAIDSTTAFVVTPFYSSSETSIYRTSDGGNTWTKVFSQTGGYIHNLHMLTSIKGIAYGEPVGGKWTILQTLNGGISWDRIGTEPIPDSLEYGSSYNSLNVLDTNTYMFLSNTKVYRTTDAGITWTTHNTPLTFLDMWINSNGAGVATTNVAGKVAQTTDNGETWTIGTIQTIGDQVGGAGTKDFWIVGDYTGQGYGLFRSTDGGFSWNLEYTSYGQYLYALDFITLENNTVGFVTGVFGAISRYSGTITSINSETLNRPLRFDLSQNYPNPFNPTTTISFTLPSQSLVSLKVFDMLGREVSTVVVGELQAGSYTRQWNAATFVSGVYFYRLQAGTYSETKKLLLLK